MDHLTASDRRDASSVTPAQRRASPTKFFKFNQNNSGGSFVIDDKRGLGVNVWIEAANAEDANDHAERVGIYFNGCDDGTDCPCCGDRWYPKWSNDAGEDRPHIDDKWDFNWDDTVYAHAIDGTIHRFRNGEQIVETLPASST